MVANIYFFNRMNMEQVWLYLDFKKVNVFQRINCYGMNRKKESYINPGLYPFI